MRTEAVLSVLIASSLLIAGCLGLGPPPDDEAPNDDVDPAPSAMSQTLTFEGCREQVGAFALPAEMFEERLPEGFETEGMDPEDETALFTVFTWACESVLVDGDPQGAVMEMVGAVNVRPPDDLQDANASAYVAILHGVTDHPGLIPVYEAWGVPIEQGEVTMATREPAPEMARSGQASSTASFRTELNTNVAGPIGERDAGQARFFSVDEGTLTGILDGWWNDVPAMQEGEATLVEAHDNALPPFIVPVQGIGYHYWGEGFGFGYKHIPLSAT